MQISQSLQTIKPSYIREILKAATADNVISLAGGLPAPELMPLALIDDALALLANQPAVFQYGETRGYGPLLAWLEHCYQLPSHHRAMLCTGSQQGLDLIARTWLNPGDGVAVEIPAYPGALQVFGLSQARIETVVQQAEGPDIEALERLFVSGKVKLFYAVPDFHNPTGVCWSLAVRRRVAELCIQHNVTLIEDAPYRELRFKGEALPLVSSFCPERSLLLRSFSKIAAPGLRLGAVTGRLDWLEPMITVKQASDLHSGLPEQALLLALLQHRQFQTHIANIREHYCLRYQVLIGAMADQLGEGFDTLPVYGGMFVWLRIPYGEPINIARAALKDGVAVVPGDVFYPDRNQAEPALRLNFSYSTPERLKEAVRRLKISVDRSR